MTEKIEFKEDAKLALRKRDPSLILRVAESFEKDGALTEAAVFGLIAQDLAKEKGKPELREQAIEVYHSALRKIDKKEKIQGIRTGYTFDEIVLGARDYLGEK